MSNNLYTTGKTLFLLILFLLIPTSSTQAKRSPFQESRLADPQGDWTKLHLLKQVVLIDFMPLRKGETTVPVVVHYLIRNEQEKPLKQTFRIFTGDNCQVFLNGKEIAGTSVNTKYSSSYRNSFNTYSELAKYSQHGGKTYLAHFPPGKSTLSIRYQAHCMSAHGVYKSYQLSYYFLPAKQWASVGSIKCESRMPNWSPRESPPPWQSKKIDTSQALSRLTFRSGPPVPYFRNFGVHGWIFGFLITILAGFYTKVFSEDVNYWGRGWFRRWLRLCIGGTLFTTFCFIVGYNWEAWWLLESEFIHRRLKSGEAMLLFYSPFVTFFPVLFTCILGSLWHYKPHLSSTERHSQPPL